jgi:aminomethyltransferase
MNGGRSPLERRHRQLGATLVRFGGWDMPMHYGGTIAEHLACRHDAAMFDVSHLGTVRLSGSEAVDRLQATLTNDLNKIGSGRAQYTHLLDEDGSVLDDIIVWWHPRVQGQDETLDVMPNASNTHRVREAIGGTDVTSTRGLIAVQGPSARSRLESVAPELAGVGRFKVRTASWQGITCLVAGTGYTGEDGVEISVPAEHAEDLWIAIERAGVTPAGLGARDTLRLEAGLPLHGHELGPGITPLQAGLDWVVAFDKPQFRGREALLAERAAGPHRRLVGIATEGRRPPRAGCAILVEDIETGVVTSGNYSPVLGHGIALGFVSPELTIGTAVSLEVRGSVLPGRIVALPFIER